MSKTEIVILVDHKHGSGSGFYRSTPSIDLKVKAREIGSDHPINLNNNTLSEIWWDDYPRKCRGMCLDGVMIHTHVYEDSTDGPCFIGLEPDIRDAFAIGLRELAGYQKALKAIYKEIANSGDPGSLGCVLTAMAKAVGATAIVFETDKSPSGWSMYRDADWHFMDLQSGARYVRQLERELLEESRMFKSGAA